MLGRLETKSERADWKKWVGNVKRRDRIYISRSMDAEVGAARLAL